MNNSNLEKQFTPLINAMKSRDSLSSDHQLVDHNQNKRSLRISVHPCFMFTRLDKSEIIQWIINLSFYAIIMYFIAYSEEN